MTHLLERRDHPISFEILMDWDEGRLGAGQQCLVTAHLLGGCEPCRADLAWLRRFSAVVRSERLADPPAAAVEAVKGMFSLNRPSGVFRGRWVTRVMALAAMLLVVIGLAFCLFYQPALVAHSTILQVAEGSAEYQPAGGSIWQPAMQQARISEGDGIRLLEGAATLELFDQSRLFIAPGTEVKFITLRSGLAHVARGIALEQTAGTVRYEVASSNSRSSFFQVHTPAGLAEVRGTRFEVRVQSAELTQVVVLEGLVEVRTAAGGVLVGEEELALLTVGEVPVVRVIGEDLVTPDNDGDRTHGVQSDMLLPEGHTPTPMPGQGQAEPGTMPSPTGVRDGHEGDEKDEEDVARDMPKASPIVPATPDRPRPPATPTSRPHSMPTWRPTITPPGRPTETPGTIPVPLASVTGMPSGRPTLTVTVPPTTHRTATITVTPWWHGRHPTPLPTAPATVEVPPPTPTRPTTHPSVTPGHGWQPQPTDVPPPTVPVEEMIP